MIFSHSFSYYFHIIFTFLGIWHFVYAQYRMDILMLAGRCSSAAARGSPRRYYIRWLDIHWWGLINTWRQNSWTCRSEGFPARDIWFLGTLEQGSARCPELLGRRRRRQLEIKIDIQARKLLLKVFLRFWGRGGRSRRMETGVLLRISIRIQ